MKYPVATLLLLASMAHISPYSVPTQTKGNATVAEINEQIPSEKVSPFGAWRVNLRRKGENDPPRAVVRVADKHLADKTMYLYAACRKGRISIWASFDHEFSTLEKEIPVTLKIDDEEQLEVKMTRSYNSKSIGVWKDEPSRKLLSRLNRHKTISMTVKPRFDPAMTARFDIDKIENVLKPVANACDWEIMAAGS